MILYFLHLVLLVSFLPEYVVAEGTDIELPPPRGSAEEEYIQKKNFYPPEDKPRKLYNVSDGDAGEKKEEVEAGSNIKYLAENLAVDAEVLFDTQVSGASVKTEVLADKVILRGEVGSEEEREVLGAKIANETGLPVENHLTIGVEALNLNTWAESLVSKILSSIVLLGILISLGICGLIVFHRKNTASKAKEIGKEFESN